MTDDTPKDRKLKARSFIHSCYVPDVGDGTDAVTVSEHLHYDNGDVEPNIRIIRKPVKTIYVTKKQFQSQHTEKKERERIDHCDVFHIPNWDFTRQAYKALYGFLPNQKVHPGKVMDSPYLYGGSASIESRIKIKYRKDFDKTGYTLAPITTGMFDTEISLVEGREGDLLCATLTHENQVYTTVNKQWMQKVVGGQRLPATLADLEKLSTETLEPIIDELFTKNKNLSKLRGKLPFKFFYHEGASAKEMLEWIFARLHENQTTFIGIWNLGYDIGQIVRLCEEYNLDPAQLFSHPSIPPEIRYFRYKEDKKRTAHIADKWHWVSSTSYSQWVDLMAIYNRLRVVNGKESSYALNYILQKNKITGKLKWGIGPNTSKEDIVRLSRLEAVEGSPDWHREMSLNFFLEYVVYNQWDSVSLQCLEWLNQDTFALRILSDNTPVANFPRQTIKNQDTLHYEWMDKGYVMGTTGKNMEEEYDDELESAGGAVLDAFRVDRTGLKVIEEYPTLVSQIHVYVSDVDFSQMYPTVMENANISKETKVSTVFCVIGEHVKAPPGQAGVECLYSYLISPQDNAHNLGRDFFNTPSFSEVLERYSQHRNQGETVCQDLVTGS